jgi:hypothetical protein
MFMSFDKYYGPVLLCDKSAIEGLSWSDEIRFLYKHFFLNIPPVLAIEILGDLKKEKKGVLPKDLVTGLAQKVHGIGSHINIHYKTLCLASLLGVPVTMDRMCKIRAGERVYAKDGTPGTLLNMSPEEEAILRCAGGEFTKAEELLAEEWRKYAKKTDLLPYKNKLNELGLSTPRVKEFAELGTAADSVLADAKAQRMLLEWFIRELGITGGKRSIIMRRWKRSSYNFIKDFAPYTHYCLRVYLVFIIGLYNSLIGPRPSHQVDLEYCYYLPFCMVFTSGDNFHKKLARLFIGSDQDFVGRDALKEDLDRIVQEWSTLNESEIIDREVNYGHFPFPKEGSVICDLWKKYMRPWRPLSGNLLYGMSAERRAEFLKNLGLGELFERKGFTGSDEDLRNILEIRGL